MAKKEKVHFIGIGGIGVSALAQYYLAKGNDVSGSDLASSEITALLKAKGAKVKIGKHKRENVPAKASIVIYSPAVLENNPEMVRAKEIKAIVQSYPEALGELTKNYFTIAVSGAHGKSTTTAMLSLILKEAKLDPTVIIGTKLKEFKNTNFRMGKGKYLIIEADEWNASFLNYWPQIIVLTNIEREHLDFYKDLETILKTFKEYVGHLPKEGMVVANQDNENIATVLEGSKLQVRNYSIKQPEAELLKKIMQVPGAHNISNALAALTAARALGVADEVSFVALSKYTGAWRRFEVRTTKIGKKRITLVSDYGHHPTEIRATLFAAREKFPNKKIWCIFQPHQYQRTFYLFDDFVRVFREAPIDKGIITDIYSVAGRESAEIKKKVNSKEMVERIIKPSVIYLPVKKIKEYLKKNLNGGEVVVIMGAGDIYDFSRQL